MKGDLFNRLNSEITKDCGFELVAVDCNSTDSEVLEAATQHIKWYRDMAEDSAQKMERMVTKERDEWETSDRSATEPQPQESSDVD